MTDAESSKGTSSHDEARGARSPGRGSTPRLIDPQAGSPGDRRVDQPDFNEKLDALIAECGGDPASYDARLIRDMLLTSLKLITDDRGTGELKLLSRSLKELRYAYKVFTGEHKNTQKISIFGSARTRPEHPDYQIAVEFSREMAERGWLSITGAGDGIMKAGHEGPGRARSFGLAIHLPFETTENDVIAGDEKLVKFRYFFTRKLMFVSQCEAVAVFPGGYGTQDELFEALTLIQTGKSAIVPIVLVEHPEGDYWHHWDNYVRNSLLGRELISPEDPGFYRVFRDAQQAADYVVRFYRNYHSSRYVRDDLIIRLRAPLDPKDIASLNDEFGVLVKQGTIRPSEAYEAEREFLHLPRIAFTHTRHKFGLVRAMIDRINEFEPAGPPVPITESSHPYPSQA
ncbi:MAG: LOG family protein [Phycisphaerales bacterium]